MVACKPATVRLRRQPSQHAHTYADWLLQQHAGKHSGRGFCLRLVTCR